MKRIEINNLLELNEEELIEKMYQDYRKNNPTAVFSGSDKEAGKILFRNIREKLHKKICIENKMCEKLSNENITDTVNVISTLADIIAALTIGVPPFVVSVLIYKIGIKKFCNC